MSVPVWVLNCAAVQIWISFCAAPYCILCGSGDFVVRPVVYKIPVLGVIFSIFWCFLSFQGSEIKEVKDGEVLNYPNVLSCGPLEPQGGWTLAGEDPKYYSKSKLWKTARREWPDVPYPVPFKPTPTPAEEEEEQDTASHSQEDLKELMAIHHSFTKLLEKMGVDPCADYPEQKVDNILIGIKSSDLQCKVCGKIYTTSMRMKRHFKKRHIGKTNYQCEICKKHYTDASSLKEHKGNHKCKHCSKRFATE